MQFSIVLAIVAAFGLLPNLAAAQQTVDQMWLRQMDDPRYLGRKLLEDGNLIEAKEVLERAELQYPQDGIVLRALAETYYRLGESNLEQGNAVEAVYYYERALTKDDSFIDTWVGLGKARFREGDFDGAIETLRRAEALGASGARALLVRAFAMRGSRAVDMSQLPAAEADLQEALRRAPADTESLLALGRLRYRQERPKEALEPLKKAAADEKFFLSATLFLGLSQEALKNWQAAIDSAATVATAPTYRADADGLRSRSYYNWGLEAYDAADWGTAEKRFLAAIEFAPDWADPIFAAGLARIKQVNGDGAVALLEPLYRNKPDHPGLNVALATAKHVVGKRLKDENQLVQAANVLTEAFKLDGQQVDILLTLGAVEEARGRDEAALEAYQTAIRTGGSLAARREAMRVLHERLGRPLQALEHAEVLLKRLPEDADAKARIVRITRSEGLAAHTRQDYEAGVRLLARHAELTELDDDVRYALAHSYTQTLAFALAYPLSEFLHRSSPGKPAIADLHYATLVGSGDEASLTRRWRDAKDFYARALEIKTERHEIRFRFGWALLQLQDYPAATEALRTVWTRAPALHARAARPLAMALTGWANAQLATDPAKTVALTTEALERDSEYPDAYMVRSRAYESQKNLDLALIDAEDYFERRAEDLDGEAWLVGLLRRGLDEAFAGSRYPVAEARAKRLLALRENDPHGIYWAGRAIYAQQRWPESEPYFSKAAAVGPYRGEAYVYMARGNHGIGAYENAAKFYLAARRFDTYAATATEQVTTFRAAAAQAESVGKHQTVAQYYGYAFLLAPTDPEIAYAFGRALVRIERAKDAVPHLRRAHQLWPDRRDVAIDYADALTSVGQPLHAVQALLKWEAPNQTGHQEIRIRVGRAFLLATYDAQTSGKLPDAAKYGVQAVDRLPNEPEAWYALGVVRFELQANNEALGAFDRVYALNPRYKEIVKYLGDVHARRGYDDLKLRNLDSAKQEFQTSLKYRETLDALYGLMLVAEQERNGQEMLRLAQTIEAKQAGYKDVLSKRIAATRILGEAAFAAGDYAVALKHFNAMLAAKPDAFEAYYYIGAVAYHNKQYGEAIKHLEFAASKVGVGFENLRTRLTNAYAAQIQQAMSAQAFDDALKTIEKSLKLDAKQPEVLMWQGSIYEQRERWNQARAAYEKALALPELKPQWRTVINTLMQNLPQAR